MMAATVAKKGSSAKKKTSAASKKKASHKKRATAATWRNRQMAPTPERYKEIQQALASRGYLQKEPNGTWDQSSTEALRRFQEDQRIEPTGKINSLSLIALGLGPKRESMPPAKPAP